MEGWRLGDVLGEDIVNSLDELTAILLRDGVDATGFGKLENIWLFMHGSTAVGKLLDFVCANDSKRFNGKWQVEGCTAEQVKAVTVIVD